MSNAALRSLGRLIPFKTFKAPRGLRRAAKASIVGAMLLLFCPVLSAAPPEVSGVSMPDRETLSWTSATGAAGYHVYRGDAAGLASGAGDCSAGSIQGTSLTVSDIPSPGTAFTFLVSAFDQTGEGTLGTSSSGDPRTQSAACVPSRRIFRPVGNEPAFDGFENWPFIFMPKEVVAAAMKKSSKQHPRKPSVSVVAATGEVVVRQTDLEIPGRSKVRVGGTLVVRGSTAGSPVCSDDDSSDDFSEDDSSVDDMSDDDFIDCLSWSWGLRRTYRSRVNWDGPLGRGWFFSDAEHLRAASGGDVEHCTGDGRCEIFASTAGGFTSPRGQFAVLRQTSSGGENRLRLREPDGTVRTFYPLDGSSVAGALEQIEDTTRGVVRFLYDHQGLLTTVVDSLGRSIDYSYDTNGRVTRVSDFDGRAVVFEYDTEGRLVSVRSPTVTGTPNGNDFPSGKTTTYSYSSGMADEQLNHNLLTITDPLGQTWLTNTYSADPDDAATGTLTFDRVLRQDIGGTNASGIPAGGAVTFSYGALNPGADPNLPDIDRRQAIVTDPNGTVVEHILNADGKELTRIVRTRGVRADDPPSWTTESRYSKDGLLLQVDLPGRGTVAHVYDSAGADRYRQGNLIELRLVADATRGDGHGGAQPDLVTTWEYEPLYNRVVRMTDPRGNDSSYVPQNGGAWSAARYTTTWKYDYQEGDPDLNGVNSYAAEWGIDLTTAEVNLGDLNGDGRVDQIGGSPVRRDDPTVELDPAGNQAGVEGDPQQEVVTLWRYNDFGQVVTRVDPTGIESTFTYHPESDPDGDGIPTPTPPDGRTLDTSTGGYLHRRNQSDLEFLRRLYDPRGNPTDDIDGRGVRHVRVYNELDQVVEVRLAAATADKSGPDGDPATGKGESGLTALSYKTRFEYDANDNLLRRQVEDRDDTRGFGGWVDTTWDYDMLDRVLRVSESSAPGTTVVTEVRYDPNGNLTRVISPEGNEVQTSYDERDLVYQVTEGAAGPFGGTPATTTFTYNGNLRLVRVDDPAGHVVDHDYDGLERLVRSTDEVGGTTELFYDPVSKVTRVLVRGTVGGPTPADRSGSKNVTLSDTRYLYDELTRSIRVDRVLDMPSGAVTQRPADLVEGGLLPGDGMVNSTVEYDASGRVTFVTSDHGATVSRTYDGRGWPARLRYPDGSRVDFTFDDGMNVIETEETDLAGAAGTPTVFLTTHFYDALGNRTMTVDNSGNTSRWVVDSFFDVTVASDPNGPVGGTIERRSPNHRGEIVTINGHGNVSEFTYDGLSRLLSVRRVLTASGQGDGSTSPAPDTSNPYNPEGEVLRSYAYDRNSRVTTFTNARGNQVSFEYDNLDRLVRQTWPDQTTVTQDWDVRSLRVQLTDQTGSVSSFSYDPAGRLTQTDVTPAVGVEGTTQQVFEYDGLGRITRAFDNNDPSTPDDDSDLRLHYDLLGRVVEEEQRVPFFSEYFAVDRGYRAEELVTSLTYPSGRALTYSYDPEGRLTQALDSATSGGQVDFTYDGMTRVLSRSAGSGIETSVTWDLNRDPASIDHNSAGTLLSGFSYGYDRVRRLTSELRKHDASGDLRRGLRFDRDSVGSFDAAREGLFNPDLSLSGPADDEQLWLRDAEGNEPEVTRNGRTYTSTPNNRERYDDPQCCGKASDDRVPDDFLDDAATPDADGRNFAHDESGNQTVTGEQDLRYDAFGRLVRVLRVSDGTLVSRYRYDAFSRLVHRAIEGTAVAPGEQHLRLHVGLRSIENRDENNLLRRQLAVTPSGAPLWQLRDFSTGTPPAEHLLTSADGSVAAVVSASGDVLERFSYGTVGTPFMLDATNTKKLDAATGAPLARSDFGVEELLRGRTYLHELGSRSTDMNLDWSGAYFAGGGIYDPNQGRYFGLRVSCSGCAYEDAWESPARALSGGGEHEVSWGTNALRVGALDPDDDGDGISTEDLSQRLVRDPHRGHVTVLKAAARDPHRGHVTVLKAAARDPHRGHVTVLKAADLDPLRGHVTVLKIAAPGTGGGPSAAGLSKADAKRALEALRVTRVRGGDLSSWAGGPSAAGLSKADAKRALEALGVTRVRGGSLSRGIVILLEADMGGD